MILEEAIPEMPTEQLEEVLGIMEQLYNSSKSSRENFSKLSPFTRMIMDFLAHQDGHPEITSERTIERLGNEVSEYSRDVELIREELERRKL